MLKQGDRMPKAPIAANEATGKPADVIAKKVGLSSATYERAKKVIGDPPEELKQKVRVQQTKKDQDCNNKV